MIEHFISTSKEQTISYAKDFGSRLKRNDIVALYGELGSGKTQFVKGICKTFNVETEATSPSFTVLNRYEGKNRDGNEILIYHFDLYRIKFIEELYDIGYEEYFANNGICLIEWAEKINELLPQNRYNIYLSYCDNENYRNIKIEKCE